MGLGLSTQVASQGLALRKGIKCGLLDPVSIVGEVHMSQHHHGAEKKSGRVCEALAGNIGGGAVDGLEDGALITNVSGRSEAETTNQTSAHIGKNVTVQVGHDQNLVVVGQRVGSHLQARVVEQLGIEFDIGELLGDVLGDVEEETVRHLHDGGLVDDANLLAANLLGVLEGKSEDTLGSLPGDELDALDNSVDNNMLDARVFTLSVLTDQDGVDIVIGGLVAGDGAAGSQVGEEVESSSQSQVKGDVALANGSLSKRLLAQYRAWGARLVRGVLRRLGVNLQREVPLARPCSSECSQWSRTGWWFCHRRV